MLIKSENVSVVRGKKEILKNIDLELGFNDFVTIIGPNGAGKSMLLKCLLGFYKPDNGQIIKSPDLKVSYVPQDFIADKSIPITSYNFIKLNKKINDMEINKISSEFNVSHLLDKQISDLSGGELQKILLVRSLIEKPNLLVLDEPTQSLDVSSQLSFYKFLGQIFKEKDISILMVSHDLHMVMSSTKRVVCLSNHICCSGEPLSITKDPEFITLFGHDFANMMSVYKHDFSHQHVGDSHD
ncbi:ATP-binding cassette domain-containing protein [bacterium]|nr:ATP-binding cassette domain-containing protein [bacterium]|tara:strand:- start:2807 stop:3529 length:723 start_codon:yes stop_codon:yes gene_type:complete